ncbi:MAG: hypothetical protein WD066_19645 [Planctomycetaceae bacterium]
MAKRPLPIDDSRSDWQRSFDDLRALSVREDDWDGEGAVRPKPELLEAAADWLRRLSTEDSSAAAPSYVSATPCGEVAVVWRSDELLLSAEFVEPDRIEWMRRVPGQPTEHWDQAV